MNYIDLLLIHEPTGNVHEIYRAMEDMYKEGYLKAIGISNFLSERYLELIKHCSIVPAVNQVETHVFRQQKELRDLMTQYGTKAEAWSPLASGENGIFTNKVLSEISKNHGKTVSKIALRFLYQQDIIIIPKSTHIERMKENLDIFDFILNENEMKMIEKLEVGRSLFNWW